MNLAEFKYRNILVENGGPIESIQYLKHLEYGGHNFFAKLKNDLILEKHELAIYQGGGGHGTSFRNKNIAYYKAISEALESWAFYDIKYCSSPIVKSRYGFDIDPTSNGMASMPGLFATSPRKNAFNEAVERWSIITWWDGLLPIIQINNSTFEIQTPWRNLKTIILKSNSLIWQKPIYAFATGQNIKIATERAQVEIFRNSRVVDHYYNNPQTLNSIMEKRLIYFSTHEGEENFNKKVFESSKLKLNNFIPKLIIDSPIVGAWNKYTFVWRCLFEPNSNHFFDSTNTKYFFF